MVMPEPRDGMHLHHAVLGDHLIELEFRGSFARTADQLVGRAALVLDGEKAAADFRAARRGAGPCLRDDEIASLDLLGARGRGEQGCEAEAA